MVEKIEKKMYFENNEESNNNYICQYEPEHVIIEGGQWDHTPDSEFVLIP